MVAPASSRNCTVSAALVTPWELNRHRPVDPPAESYDFVVQDVGVALATVLMMTPVDVWPNTTPRPLTVAMTYAEIVVEMSVEYFVTSTSNDVTSVLLLLFAELVTT